jgi:chemotaxis protein MotB
MNFKQRLLSGSIAALALSSSACGVDQALYNARVDELTKAKADMDAQAKACADAKQKSDAQIQSLGGDNDALKQRLAALGQDANQKASNIADLQKQMDELKKKQEAAEARAKQFDELKAKLKAMVDAGKLKVEIRDGLMLVKLADNILFDPGKTDLKKEGKDAVVEVAKVLADLKDRKFQVAGHTDNAALGRGSKYKDNWALSTARAVEVVNYMIANGGMPANRLSAAGYADQMPVASNDSDDGRKQNRRIEIVLVPNIDQLGAQ